jgi:hypothetical protein
VAAGCQDGSVYVFKVAEGAWAVKLKISKHAGPVTKLDFTADGLVG